DVEVRFVALEDESAAARRTGHGPSRGDRAQLGTGRLEPPDRGLPARAHRDDGTLHSSATPAQVNPEPNAMHRTRSPAWRRPAASASASAMGIEAALVLPKRSTFTYTLSITTP